MGRFISSIVFLLILIPHTNKAQVIISEVMFDPTPSVGLPAAEYIEIYNTTTDTIKLVDWKISDLTSVREINNGIIPPLSFSLLVDEDDTAAFEGLNLLSTSRLPSLNNSGDVITLFDNTDNLIDQLNYTSKWHSNSEKDEGGYSIEKAVLDRCQSAQRWGTTIDLTGGTPGKENSISWNISIPTKLIQAIQHQDTIHLSFTSSLPRNVEHFKKHLLIDKKAVTELIVKENIISIPMKGEAIQLDQFPTCGNDKITQVSSVVASRQPFIGELIINEMLFDPEKGRVEFIELYNPSNSGLLLDDLMLVSLKEDHIPKDAAKIISTKRAIPPNGYLVLTKDKQSLMDQFQHLREQDVLEIDLPILTNTFGHFELWQAQFRIDSARYYPDYQSEYYDKTKGVSLERSTPYSNGLNSDSWHSCASSYRATPGLPNSQQAISSKPTLSLGSKSFSPNFDLYRDELEINITANSPAALTIEIYFLNGNKIRTLIENEIPGSINRFLWDGTDDAHQIVPQGFYIVYSQLITPKKTIVLKAACAVEY